jgi:hypothetical protein
VALLLLLLLLLCHCCRQEGPSTTHLLSCQSQRSGWQALKFCSISDELLESLAVAAAAVAAAVLNTCQHPQISVHSCTA